MALTKEDEELLDFDFEIEVEETKEKIVKAEETVGQTDTKAGKLLNKLDKISQNFDIAETTADELALVVEEEVGEVKNLPSMQPSDMFQLEMLQSDFMNVRTTLMDTVTKGKSVIDTLTNELILNPTDAEMVASYSQLISVVNSSMRLLSGTYKDISEIVSKVKKLEEQSGQSTGPGGVTNIQNNFFAENTNDIIKQLRGDTKKK